MLLLNIVETENDFERGSINFSKKRNQPVKDQHLDMTPLTQLTEKSCVFFK